MTALAIVGMACRYPDAASPDELWENVLAQRRAFRRLPAERLRGDDYFSADRAAPDRTYSLQAAVLDGWDFDRVRFRISGRAFRATDLAHWLALEVATEALASAGHPDGAGLDRDRTAVIVGNTLTGEFSRAHALRLRWPYVRRVVRAALEGEGVHEDEQHRVLARLEREFKRPFAEVDEETLAGGLSNTIAGRICNAFDLKGGGYTVDGACASSLLAIATAGAALERGDADVAIAGGVDLSLDPFELVGFAKATALAPDEMRVYDRRSQGFWPGEGCGFVVLRRLEDALADGVDAPVAIRGWGISSDGAGGITRPELSGQRLALARAYGHAGFDIGSVELFEGHGTGTAVGDAVELAALAQARSEAGAASRAAVGSIKANIGHTKAAAGVAGLIKAALGLREEVIPPATACGDPHEELCRDDATLRVATEAEPWPADRPRRAAVSAMGFGGVNSHVVLERVAPAGLRRPGARARRLSASAQDAELFLFAGRRTEVAASIAALAAVAETLSLAELGDAAAAVHAQLPAARGGVRAAAVASSPAELALVLASLERALAGAREPLVDAGGGAFLGVGTPARVGLLFSGQGVAATTGGALARRFACVRAALADVSPPPAGGDPLETAFAQPAIVGASLAGLALLDAVGAEAELAVGHSLGELTALHWGGALDAETLLDVATGRGRAMSELGRRDGAMAMVAAEVAVAERLCAGTGAVVACLNAPDRTIVSGPADAVAGVSARAGREGIATTPLGVSHAFHSALVAPAVEPLRALLARTPIEPLRRRVVSTVTGDLLAPDADVVALLARQMTAPVLFAQALETAAAEVDLFVEVGPGAVLAGLSSAQQPLPAVALDVGGASLRPALTALGALFAAGALADTAPLFEGRFVRPFRVDAARQFLANPCEAAPADDAPGPAEETDAVAVEAPEPAGDALEVVRGLVAQRAELPAAAVADEARLLADLRLSSIMVGEIAASAAKALGVAPPLAPGELATATVAGLAEALARLAETAPDAEPAVPAGADVWTHPYERVLVERERPPAGGAAATRWHVLGRRGDPFVDAVAAAFTVDGDGGDATENGMVVALGPDRDESALRLLAEAARCVREHPLGRFVVVEQGEVAAAFARVVHLEHGLPTCVVGVERLADLAHARAEAESAPAFAEVRFDSAGRRRAPVLRPLELRSGTWPLAHGDLALVTGGGKGIAAECALALAQRHGLSLLLVGRSDPATDAELAANLRRFTAAGVDVTYARADVCDEPSLRAVLRAAAAARGPVRAILHGAGVNEPALLGDVDAELFARTIGPKVDGLRNAIDAVDLRELRLLVGFGSIIGAMGLRGEAHYALANEWLRLLVEDVAARAPWCRCVDVGWSVWAGVGMGERLGTLDALARFGVDPIGIDDGIALLDELACAQGAPTSVIATSRFGLPPTVELESRPRPLLRFVEHPLLEYPGVEEVVETELGAGTDPYLAEHVLDGVPLLPATVGLEAMAQTAAVVLGRAPELLEDVAFPLPVTVPPDGPRRIRVAASRRRDGNATVVLRSDESGFHADHFRMTCGAGASRDTAAAQPAPGEVPLRPADVYDALLFHGPRFRRLERYRVLEARRCVAELAARSEPWFGPFLPQRLVLGDPGLHDAAIHVLQACIPGERVLPVGVDRIAFVRRPGVDERVLVSARERSDDGSELVWDLDLVRADGTLLERWSGLRLRRIGPAGLPDRWPVPLLVPYLERRVADLAGSRIDVALAPRAGSSDGAIAAAVGAPARVERRADGRPEVAGRAVSAAHVDGFTLALAGDGTLACDVERVVDRDADVWRDLLGGARFGLADRISGDLGERFEITATRLWAASECVRKAGRSLRSPLTLVTSSDDGWVVLRAGQAPVATYCGRVAGADAPLAFAFLAEAER